MKEGIKNSNHILLCPLLIKYFYYLDSFISRKHLCDQTVWFIHIRTHAGMGGEMQENYLGGNESLGETPALEQAVQLA